MSENFVSLARKEHTANLAVLRGRPAESSGIEEAERRTVQLSIIMPVHNEEATVRSAVIDVLRAAPTTDFELIVVDDGSADRTSEILSTLKDSRVTLRGHDTNQGKGAAVLTGARAAGGSHLVIFDADGEYRAADLKRLVEPVECGIADVVYGVRMFGMNTVYHSYRYAIGNRVTTFVANVMYDACLTDLHTCLKLMPMDIFRSLHLTTSGFGLDSEITGELLRRGYRPYEVPISYVSRSHAQGKKLTWKDGVNCLAVLGRVRLRGRRALPDVATLVEHQWADEECQIVLTDTVDDDGGLYLLPVATVPEAVEQKSL